MPGSAEAANFVRILNEVIIYPLILLLVAVSFLVFVYGCFEYVLNSDDSTARDTGRRHIIWGVAGFLVIVGAYSILSIAANTFGLYETLQCAEDGNCSVTPDGNTSGASPF